MSTPGAHCPACGTVYATGGDVATVKAAYANHKRFCGREDTEEMHQQCSKCEQASAWLTGDGAIEDLAAALGGNPTAWQVHLIQHRQDELLRRLTHGGQPILPEPVASDRSAPEPEPEPAPEPEAQRVQVVEWTPDPEPQPEPELGTEHRVAAALEAVLHTLGPAVDSLPELEAVEQSLAALVAAADAQAQQAELRQELAELEARRAEILQQLQPQKVVKADPSQVRDWARQHGYKVSGSGPLPKALLDAYVKAVAQ